MEYKLGETALAEIVECVRKGLCEGVDISDLLRKIEVTPDKDERLQLTLRYLAEKGRPAV